LIVDIFMSLRDSLNFKTKILVKSNNGSKK